MLVRRLLAVAGATGLLLLGLAGAALAAPAPSPEATAQPGDTPTEAPLPPDQPTTTTDCGLPPNGETSSDTSTAGIEPSPEPATPGLDPGVICIASGVNTGGGVPVDSAGGGEGAPAADPAQLPRTGPAPVLPVVAIGSWLLLIGVLAAVAGRRRTPRTCAAPPSINGSGSADPRLGSPLPLPLITGEGG